MKKLLLVPLVALSLGGCGPMLGALLNTAAPPPQAVANRTVLDEQGALTVEALYTAAARAGALAFRTGIIQPSSNPAVQQDNFCQLVMARVFTPTDRGSSVAALECKLRAARDAVRHAYDAGNAADYATAMVEARAASNQILAFIHGD